MSQASVERALGKLITDECFRNRFFENAAAASFAAGLELSADELEALRHLPRKALARVGMEMDGRICRLPYEAVPRPDAESISGADHTPPPGGRPAGSAAARAARKKTT